MPVGLDGSPEPISTPERDAALDQVIDAVTRLSGDRVLVGVDGGSGSGKSTLADELAVRLELAGMSVIRSTTDSFHRPRAERMRLGPTSAEGYYRDSHQLSTIVDELLTPFAGGAPRVRLAAFDEPTDSAVDVVAEVPAQAVLVFDGLFLHRPELTKFWDLSVLLVADARRDQAWLDYLESDLPQMPTDRAIELDSRLEVARWPRYRDGWRLYLDQCQPDQAATIVIDNDDLQRPRVVRSD